MHPEGHATGHLDTGILGFPLSLSKCWDGSRVLNCCCLLLMQPSRFKLIKITPCAGGYKINFLSKLSFHHTVIRKSKFRFGCACYKHMFLITLTTSLILPLYKRRTGIAWEPSNKITLFLPNITRLSLLSHNFLFAFSLLLSFLTFCLFRKSTTFQPC
jgi:hypothetical protein